MTTPPVRLERRVCQRFSYLLPVLLRDSSAGTEAAGFTQDVSSRGVFLFTDASLCEGAPIELALKMPSEITLGDSMRVCARGHVLRVVKRAIHGLSESGKIKIGVAIRLEGYEYLPDSADVSATYQRVSALHSHHDEDSTLAVHQFVR